MKTKVRAHRRKGTRGVRAHYRNYSSQSDNNLFKKMMWETEHPDEALQRLNISKSEFEKKEQEREKRWLKSAEKQRSQDESAKRRKDELIKRYGKESFERVAAEREYPWSGKKSLTTIRLDLEEAEQKKSESQEPESEPESIGSFRLRAHGRRIGGSMKRVRVR